LFVVHFLSFRIFEFVLVYTTGFDEILYVPWKWTPPGQPSESRRE